MWISGGEQDISENILQMVLARTPDAPPGMKGISLFLVPKIHVQEDGSLGAPNYIALAGLNHKMGQRGTSNTLLNFGEGGDCLGYLVGEENEGLKNMFHMMNEARIGVGCWPRCRVWVAIYTQSIMPATDHKAGTPVIQIRTGLCSPLLSMLISAGA